MSSSFLIGPIAPESNPPIHPEYFKPSVFFISDLTVGIVTIVTTSVNHNYVLGQSVRLLIPETYGSRELNEKIGTVIGIPAADQVTLDINSQFVNPFIPVPGFGPTRPQIVAIGDINTGVISSTGRVVSLTTIPGSFQNISPV